MRGNPSIKSSGFMVVGREADVYLGHDDRLRALFCRVRGFFLKYEKTSRGKELRSCPGPNHQPPKEATMA